MVLKSHVGEMFYNTSFIKLYKACSHTRAFKKKSIQARHLGTRGASAHELNLLVMLTFNKSGGEAWGS